jgi:hypothetical protein
LRVSGEGIVTLHQNLLTAVFAFLGASLRTRAAFS